MSPSSSGSNFLTYLTVGVVALGAMGFMWLLFGELFIVAVAVFVGIGGIGCLHYFVWGRAMTENAKKEAKAELQATEPD